MNEFQRAITIATRAAQNAEWLYDQGRLDEAEAEAQRAATYAASAHEGLAKRLPNYLAA